LTDFATADLHLGHGRIREFCPGRTVLGPTVEDMDIGLIRRWNETATDDDTVWVLGDLAMGRIEESLEKASDLRGNKILIPANHDRCWPGGKPDWKDWVPRYEKAGFEIVFHEPGNVVTIPVLNLGVSREVRLCHFPAKGDSQGVDRYSAWRPEPGPLLHGHVHDHWTVMKTPSGSLVNVGVDVWDFKPMPLEGLAALLWLT
jgi:calcineurin-like phosphoesterase family protein